MPDFGVSGCRYVCVFFAHSCFVEKVVGEYEGHLLVSNTLEISHEYVCVYFSFET